METTERGELILVSYFRIIFKLESDKIKFKENK
jgi:hypothetical protein